MSNGDDEKKASPPSIDIPSTEFKSAKDILKDSISSIKELAPVYQGLGWAGFFGVSSVVIALLTIVLSFYTGTESEGSWFGGITLYEEILFMAISALFAIVGLIFLIKRTENKVELQKIQIEIDHNQNKWLHEETMAKLNLPMSQGSSTKPRLTQNTTGKQDDVPNG